MVYLFIAFNRKINQTNSLQVILPGSTYTVVKKRSKYKNLKEIKIKRLFLLTFKRGSFSLTSSLISLSPFVIRDLCLPKGSRHCCFKFKCSCSIFVSEMKIYLIAI